MSLLEDITARHKAFHARIAAQAAQLEAAQAAQQAAARIKAGDAQKFPRFVAKGFRKPREPARLSVWDELAWNVAICGQDDIAPLTMNRIKHEVCRHFSLTPLDLVSQRRTQVFVLPRFIAYRLSKELTGNSTSQIARYFGNRDHTTVLSGLKRIERLISKGHPVANDLSQIRSKLV